MMFLNSSQYFPKYFRMYLFAFGAEVRNWSIRSSSLTEPICEPPSDRFERLPHFDRLMDDPLPKLTTLPGLRGLATLSVCESVSIPMESLPKPPPIAPSYILGGLLWTFRRDSMLFSTVASFSLDKASLFNVGLVALVDPRFF